MMCRRSVEQHCASAGSGCDSRGANRRGFSLAELIAAIALLSMFGVIAARMFFLSDGLSRKTERFDKSVMLAANIAEAWQAATTEDSVTGFADSKSLAGFKPDEFITDSVGELEWIGLLDDQLLPSSADQSNIRLTVRQEQTAVKNVWQLVILIEEFDKGSIESENASGEMIYELAASRYIPQEAER